MNLEELIEEYRNLADDTASGGLWSDAEITRYANEAERDAVERGFLIEDDETAEICEIEVEAETAVYPLDSRILRINRAKLDLSSKLLYPTDKSVLDRRLMASWPTNEGAPFCYIDRINTLLLVWIPIADDTLRLSVNRLPLEDMEATNDEPEIPANRHYELLYGMLARGYMKRDDETFNPIKAADYEAMFTRAFGEKIDANVRKKQRASRSNAVQMNHF